MMVLVVWCGDADTNRWANRHVHIYPVVLTVSFLFLIPPHFFSFFQEKWEGREKWTDDVKCQEKRGQRWHEAWLFVPITFHSTRCSYIT